MNRTEIIGAGILAVTLAVGQTQGQAPAPKRVMIVDATLGFRHSAIPMSEKIIADLGEKSNAYKVVEIVGSGDKPKNASDATKWETEVRKKLIEKLAPDYLKNFDLVIFNSTTGDLLPQANTMAFLGWITNGGAFVGMHAASDTLHTAPQFIEMIGGEFKTHDREHQHVDCINQDTNHPATRHFGPVYSVYDEMYQFENFERSKVHGLLGLDKKPDSTQAPGDYPVSWCKQYGKGKVFYTSLGHREDVWSSEPYQQHILGGIKWALGLEPGSAIPQVQATRPPSSAAGK